MEVKFKDRKDAGKKLAEKLSHYKGREDIIVIGLPRGGVPVAYEVAKALNAPLDIFLVRKLGVPGHEELGMGAIASGGVHVLNEDVVEALEVPEKLINKIAEREQEELERRERVYRGERPPAEIKGKTVILIDDGLATGSSMIAAIEGLRAQGPEEIIVAVPTASPETCEALENEVHEIVCASTPSPFYGVGLWYQDFSQTTDEEVRTLLQEV